MIFYFQEYEVSNLDDSSLTLPEDQDQMLQYAMHILREESSEAEYFDADLSNSEIYMDDMSDDFTVNPVELQQSTDREDLSDIDAVSFYTLDYRQDEYWNMIGY